MKHFPSIQGMRALAILLVIASHYKLQGFANGFIGVDIFFVVSGFVISGLIISRLDADNFSFVEFYAQRFKRLLPSLALMLVVVSLVSCLLMPPLEQQKEALVAVSSSVWLSNWHYVSSATNYFDSQFSGKLFLHTWSLGIEEQFYLIWPSILLLISAFSIKVVPRILWVGIITASALVVSIYLSQKDARYSYFATHARLWQFSLGALVYVFLNDYCQHLSNTLRKVLLCISITLILCGLVIIDKSAYSAYWALIPSVSTALLILVVRSGDGLGNKILSLPPLVYLGDRSYTLYLWHWPIYLLLGLIVSQNEVLRVSLSLFLTFLISILVFRCFENPVRKLKVSKHHFGKVILASVVVSALLVVGFLWWHKQAIDAGFRFKAPKREGDYLYSVNCDQWVHSSELKICEFGDITSNKELVVVGDSMASQWYSAFLDVAKKNKYKLVYIVKSACPMADVDYFYSRLGRNYSECSEWRESLISYLNEHPPERLVVASGAEEMALEKWSSGTKSFMNRIYKPIKNIYVIAATPRLNFDATDCLAREKWIQQRLNISTCYGTYENSYRDSIGVTIKKIVESYPNGRYLDFNEDICPGGVCFAAIKGQCIFRDDVHLCSSFAKRFSTKLDMYIE